MQYTKKRVITKAIPDNDTNGLRDRIIVGRDLTVKDVKVMVNIQHPYVGDISIELMGPSNKKKTILNPSRVPGENLQKTFSGDVMDVFKGIKSKGEWTIKVVDSGARDSGTLVDWSLDLELANSKKTEIFVTDISTLHSNQECHQGGRIVDIDCHVNIEHSHIGDLQVELVSPSGKSTVLHNKTGGSENNLIKSFDKGDLKNFLGDTAKGKWSLKVNDQMKGDNGRLVKWGVKFKTTDAPVKDDLTKIEGIGPKIKELLYGGKIYSFQQLSQTDSSHIKSILNDAGPRFQMHDPTSWPRQAALAASGNWEELKVLQDELDGGK